MRIATIPENPAEWLALRFGRVPTPLCDVLVGPMLARAVIAASALHVFDALDGKPLTAVEVADRCGTDPGATERLLRALRASKYLNQDGGSYRLTPASRRWLLRGSGQSLHMQCFIAISTCDLWILKATFRPARERISTTSLEMEIGTLITKGRRIKPG